MFLNGRFADAITAYESVLEDPNLTPEVALECHRYLVVLYDLTADGQRAQAHAQAAAALDSEVQAPEGASAEAERLLREAVAAQQPARVVVAPVGATREHDALSVRARLVDGEGLGLEALRLRCTFAGEEAETRGELSATELIREDAQSPVQCDASALTPQGAALVEGRLSFRLEPAILPSPTSSEDSGHSSNSRRRRILGISLGAGALVVVGVVLAVVLSGSSNPKLGTFEPSFADATSP